MFHTSSEPIVSSSFLDSGVLIRAVVNRLCSVLPVVKLASIRFRVCVRPWSWIQQMIIYILHLLMWLSAGRTLQAPAHCPLKFVLIELIWYFKRCMFSVFFKLNHMCVFVSCSPSTVLRRKTKPSQSLSKTWSPPATIHFTSFTRDSSKRWSSVWHSGQYLCVPFRKLGV